jgi:glutamyl-tRNA synthetase
MDVHPDFPVNINYTGVTYAQVSKKGKPMESASCLAGLKELEVFDTEGKLIFQLNNELDSIVTEKTEFTLENCKEFRFTRQEVFYQDQIKGELAKPLDSMKDLVIIRSDGSPVFHLANVCDDVEQEVTHIIRGDDHVENTYRHIFLFHALGYKIPKYGHMPMIVNQSGKPYSKRDGDAFVGDFRDKGYLSDALFNYLSLLGWAPGDDREKLSRQELIEAFSLERVKSSPAQLDFNKLLNMNGLYIAEMQTADFAAYAWNFRNDFDWLRGVEFDNFAKIAGFMQSRTRLISQLEDWKYFFSDDLNYNHKLARKALKKEEIKSGLEVLAEKQAELKDFTLDNFESAIRGVEADFDLEQGKLNQPLRIAVTGSGAGADIFETLKLIGPQKIAARIEASLAMDFSGETV